MSNKTIALNNKTAFLVIRNALIHSISKKAITNQNDIKNIGVSLNYIDKKLRIDLTPRLETIKEEEEIDSNSK